MANEKKLFGNYLGIVVQNNDPQQRGRVKVFVPDITAATYSGWQNTLNDKKFNFVGNNINSSVTDILSDLKKQLPWAECAAPLASEVSGGRFNYFSSQASISDTARLSTFAPSLTKNIKENNQNVDDIGEKPANIYESVEYKLHDAFNDPERYNTNIANKYSFNYTPNSYSNKAKGSFGVPNVGAHVWVFFQQGDRQRPVYFAVAYGKEDWKGIYDTIDNVGNDANGQDYPGIFENYTLSGNEIDINVETYRNKYVINQKGGTLEFINTDNREALKLTHFSGSFKEFNNYTNTELATQNDQKLVLQDQFLTVNGFKNLYVGRDFDSVIKGDVYRKIGDLNYLPYLQYKELLRPLADIKQLFETKRSTTYSKGFINFTSKRQTKSGTAAKCPVCSNNKTNYWKLNNIFKFAKTGEATSLINSPWANNGQSVIEPLGLQPAAKLGLFNGNGKIFGETCPVCNGTGLSPSSQDGNFDTETIKNEIPKYIEENLEKFTELEKQMGLGGSEIINITKNKIETIGLDINDLPSTRIDKLGKMSVNAVIVHKEGVFNSQQPSPIVEYVHVDDLPGGTYTMTIGNRYNVMVGSGGINFKSYGPVNISGTITNIAGQQINISSENEVCIDGGQKLQLIADIVNLKQRNNQQVVVDSNLGVTSNVVVGGGMHVEGELFVNHITCPAEISETNRVTATGTTNNTLPKIIGFMGIAGGEIIGYCLNPENGAMLPVFSSSTGGPGGPPAPVFSRSAVQQSDPDCVIIYAHSHTVKSIPMTVVDSHNDVRTKAKILNNNSGSRASPGSVNNTKK